MLWSANVSCFFQTPRVFPMVFTPRCFLRLRLSGGGWVTSIPGPRPGIPRTRWPWWQLVCEDQSVGDRHAKCQKHPETKAQVPWGLDEHWVNPELIQVEGNCFLFNYWKAQITDRKLRNHDWIDVRRPIFMIYGEKYRREMDLLLGQNVKIFLRLTTPEWEVFLPHIYLFVGSGV